MTHRGPFQPRTFCDLNDADESWCICSIPGRASPAEPMQCAERGEMTFTDQYRNVPPHSLGNLGTLHISALKAWLYAGGGCGMRRCHPSFPPVRQEQSQRSGSNTGQGSTCSTPVFGEHHSSFFVLLAC